jgi:hypothetical protein
MARSLRTPPVSGFIYQGHFYSQFFSSSDRITQRLIRDLDRWRALEHPNIGPILGVVLHISNLPALVVPSYRTVAQTLADNACTDVLHLVEPILIQPSHDVNYLHRCRAWRRA